MKKIALILVSLVILTILGQDVFAEEYFCKYSSVPVDLEYLFDDGTIQAICLTANAFAIEVFLTTEEDGILTMTIPRNVLDVRNPDCTDKTFMVLGDKGDPKVFETNTTADSRTIEIHYNSQEVREFLIITTDIGIAKPYKLGSECSEESFADELDSDYGEYVSPGNVWVEITHSAANPPPWSKWSGEYLKKYYPEEYKKNLDEFELIQKFYGQYDIIILDVIKSQKNAQVCEGVGCLFGTYHLLIPEKDTEKFQNIDFKQMIFETIPSPKKQIKIGIDPKNVTCNDGLELIFKSTDGSPACVKPKTSEKLIERGWAKPSEQIKKTENIQKFDTAFYLKIQKLIDEGETRPYSVVFFVNDANKDKLEKVLIENHNATNVNKLSRLSFVIAKVPIPEIPKLADYDFVLQIGGGEEKVTIPERHDSKIWMEFFPVRCIGFDCSNDFLMDNEIEPKNNYSVNLFSGFQSFDIHNWNNKLLIKPNIITDSFMKEHGVHVYDVKFYETELSVCEWGECEDKYTLYLKVSGSDFDKMMELGYMISTEDALNYVDTKQYWTFIPVKGYSCGDVDCKFVNGNSNCPSTLRGYLVKENNELVTPHERFLLDLVEIDYSQCLK